jgi:hypothetical protein
VVQVTCRGAGILLLIWKESCFYASKFFQSATALLWKEKGIFSVVQVKKKMYEKRTCVSVLHG